MVPSRFIDQDVEVFVEIFAVPTKGELSTSACSGVLRSRSNGLVRCPPCRCARIGTTMARRLLPQTLRCCCFRLECSRSLSAAVGVCSTLEAASISTAAEMHSHIAGSAGPLKWLGLPNVCTWVRRWIFRPPERQRLKRTRQSSSPGRIGLALWRSRSGTTMPPRRRAEHPTIY